MSKKLTAGSITFGPASSFPADWRVADADDVRQLQEVSDKYETRYWDAKQKLEAAKLDVARALKLFGKDIAAEAMLIAEERTRAAIAEAGKVGKP